MIHQLSIDALAVERGERRLFQDVHLGLRAGEAAALVGANGAGKTSLLRAVAGLLRPAAGTIRFEGANGALEADDARAAGLHLLGHHDGLKTSRTAGEELAFWAAWLAPAPDFGATKAPPPLGEVAPKGPEGAPEGAAAKRSALRPPSSASPPLPPRGEDLLREAVDVPLADRAQKAPPPLGEVAPKGPEGAPEGAAPTRSAPQPPSSASPPLPPGGEDLFAHAVERLQLGPLLGLDVRRLSAGQRRRLALARLVASPRPLWLLDEPLAPLDASQRARFGELMVEHLDRGGLILAAVHDPLPVPARAVVVGAAP